MRREGGGHARTVSQVRRIWFTFDVMMLLGVSDGACLHKSGRTWSASSRGGSTAQ